MKKIYTYEHKDDNQTRNQKYYSVTDKPNFPAGFLDARYWHEQVWVPIEEFENALKTGEKRVLDLLESKEAMGFELDSGIRAGDLHEVVKWLKEKLK